MRASLFLELVRATKIRRVMEVQDPGKSSAG